MVVHRSHDVSTFEKQIDLIEEGPGDQRDKEDIDNLGSINVVLTSNTLQGQG